MHAARRERAIARGAAVIFQHAYSVLRTTSRAKNPARSAIYSRDSSATNRRSFLFGIWISNGELIQLFLRTQFVVTAGRGKGFARGRASFGNDPDEAAGNEVGHSLV